MIALLASRWGLRAVINVAFAALGVMLWSGVEGRRIGDQRRLAAVDPARFVRLEIPVEHDWSRRDDSYVIRATRFVLDGESFGEPLAVWARFEPPRIAHQALLRVEGFLRMNERGEYSVSVKSPELLSYAGAMAWWHPAAWNRALARRLEARLADFPDEVALAEALLLGRGELLSDEMHESFRRGGTYHLLVFSGLQIAFAAGLLAALLRWLHAPRASDWLLLLFAALAPPFIGPTPSVSRASTAIALYAVSRLLRRPTSMENLWCVAALVWLVLEPRDLTDPSFHLTYGGAGALLFAGRIAKHRWLGHAAAAEIVIAPVTLFHFNQYALGGSVLTLLMAPVVFAILVVSAMATVVRADLLFRAIGLLHDVCAFLNRGGLSGFFAAPPAWAIAAGGAMAMISIAMLRGRPRAFAVASAMAAVSLSALLVHAGARQDGGPRIEFLDVGQGDAILLRSRGSAMLVDGGRHETIERLLASRGIRTIDIALLTHAHPDHCVGLAAAVEGFRVRELWLTPRWLRGECAARVLGAASATHTPIHIVRDGDRAMIGEIAVVAMLADLRFRRSPENNGSVVVQATIRRRRFLLTGDIEQEAEIVLRDRPLGSELLKVAHHGSRSSSSEAFLAAVDPRIAVLSCGRRNLFGHPHPSVLESLAARRIRLWRTDRDGSIVATVKGGRLYVRPVKG